jgi:hypothetical protein
LAFIAIATKIALIIEIHPKSLPIPIQIPKIHLNLFSLFPFPHKLFLPMQRFNSQIHQRNIFLNFQLNNQKGERIKIKRIKRIASNRAAATKTFGKNDKRLIN